MSKPSHIYIDLDMINNSAGGDQVPLSFEETRLHPFLDGDASDYYCTIVRFNIQTGDALPVMIPVIDTTQGDKDVTVYKVTIKRRNRSTGTVITSAEEAVVYVPSDHTVPVPSLVAGGVQDVTSGYYNVYQYQDFVDMVNSALDLAWREAIVGTDVPEQAPFLEFNPETYACSINTPRQCEPGRSDPNDYYDIYFNSRLFELFIGFPADYYSDGQYKIKVRNRGESNVRKLTYPGNVTIDYLQMYQEMSSVGMWNPVSAVVFATTSLPIHPTQTSAPRIYNDKTNSTGIGYGSPNIANILSDFAVPISATNQYRPEISYTPSAEYRLIDMFSNHNLTRIDLQVYWKDKYGNFHRFYLQPGCAAHIKILFRLKGWNA